MREIKFRFWNKTKKRFEDEYVAPFLYSGGQLMFSYPSNAKFSEQLEEIIPLQYMVPYNVQNE